MKDAPASSEIVAEVGRAPAGVLHEPPQTAAPRVLLWGENELVSAGLQPFLASYGDRVELVSTGQTPLVPIDPNDLHSPPTAPAVDIVLFEPMDLPEGKAQTTQQCLKLVATHVVAFTWADLTQLRELGLLSGTMVIDQRATAAQLVSALECLHAGRPVPSSVHPPERRVAVTQPTRLPLSDPWPNLPQSARPRRREGGGVTGSGQTSNKTRNHQVNDVGLTEREKQIICLVTAGETNRGIASALDVSLNTVKTYVRTAYRKIGADRRTQAMLWGLEHGYGDTSSQQ